MGAHIQGKGLTARQEQAIERLRAAIFQHDGRGNDGFEFKQFDVLQHGAMVLLISEVGVKDDEGNPSRMSVRRKRFITAGPGGGCTLMNPFCRKSSVMGFNNCVQVRPA